MMKLSMCLLLGVVALLELSYAQLSLQNCVGSNCNSNNIFGRKRRQILEEILSEAETEDAIQDFGSRSRNDLKRIKQDIVDVLNALTVEALEVEDSTKGLASTDVITAIVELLEAEDGQDQFGLQRKQILEEMLSEFEEDDSNHEVEKRDADPGFKVKSHKFDGHKFGGLKFFGHKTKSQPKKHHTPVHRAPVHHAPAHQAPVHHAPVHKTSVHHAPVHKTSVHHAPVHKTPVHHKVHGHKFLKHQSKKHHGKRDAEEEDETVTKEDLAKIKQDIVDVLNELTVESLEVEASSQGLDRKEVLEALIEQL